MSCLVAGKSFEEAVAWWRIITVAGDLLSLMVSRGAIGRDALDDSSQNYRSNYNRHAENADFPELDFVLVLQSADVDLCLCYSRML